ncbi:MAG TPA: hypothetical protein PKN28_05025, partial [Clostridiales bacterium]|nr:hypothetical protein [Clostridiales bacterium]
MLKKMISVLLVALLATNVLLLSVSAEILGSGEIKNISAVATGALIENTDGSIISDYNPDTDEWDQEYFHYYVDNLDILITVNYKDGTSITGTDYEIYKETGEWVYFESEQSYETPWGVGKHTATAWYMGVSAEFEVEVIENPYSEISISGDNELIITLTKANGDTIEHKAMSFEPYTGDDESIEGRLLTDKGKFNHVTFTFDESEDNFDYQNITLKYGALESNAL